MASSSAIVYLGFNFSEIDWTDLQLDGHEQAEILPKNGRAWWWAHGVPTRLQENRSQLFWCCRHCNQSGEQHKHVYDITKGRVAPGRHLKAAHDIVNSNTTTSTQERSLLSPATSLREHNDLNLSAFRSLLRWVVHDNISFRKVESEHFQALLVYIDTRLKGQIGTRRSIRRWIIQEYEKQAKVIKAVLANSQSLIHVSFDLWTSRNLLSLNGIIVHFVDKEFRAQTFLLALPEQENEHTGVNIAEMV